MENPFALKDTKSNMFGVGRPVWALWCMSLILALQRQEDLWVQGYPGLHSKLLESQDYIETFSQKKKKREKSN